MKLHAVVKLFVVTFLLLSFLPTQLIFAAITPTHQTTDNWNPAAPNNDELSSPVLKSPSGTTISHTPIFEWLPVSTAVEYQYELRKGTDTVAAGADVPLDLCTEWLCQWPSPIALEHGTYYWRVRYYDGSQLSLWSEEPELQIVPEPVTVLIEPSGTETNNMPVYSWQPVSEATGYRWQVYGPPGIVLDQEFSGSSICTETLCEVPSPFPLENGNYSWRVQTSDVGVYGSWSVEALFTLGNPPTMVGHPRAPSGTIHDAMPTYSWPVVSEAANYNFQITDRSNVLYAQWYDSATICSDTTCAVIPELPLSTGDYSWKVQSVNDGGTSWFVEDLFTLAGAPDPVFVMYSPSGSIDSNTPTYSWFPSSNATGYQLEVNSTSGLVFSEEYSASSICSGSSCSVMPSVVLEIQNYSWRVRPSSDGGYGLWSNYVDFTVVPPDPTLHVILNNPSGTSHNRPTYQWTITGSAGWYHLIVDTGTTELVNEWYNGSQACAGTQCSAAPDVGLFSGNYQWRIQAWRDGAYGPWANKGFSVNIESTVVLVSPSQTLMTNTPKYIWSPNSLAVDYQLQVIGSSGVVTDQTYAGAELCPDWWVRCEVISPTTLDFGDYRWRVRLWDGSTYGPWSIEPEFTAVPDPVTVLIQPSGTVTDTMPVYNWQTVPGATRYRLQAYGPPGVIHDEEHDSSAICSGSSCNVPSSSSLGDGEYRWRVQSLADGLPDGFWSADALFTLGNPLAAVSHPRSPSGTIHDNMPTFSWPVVNEATSYRVQVKSIAGTLHDEVYDSTTACTETTCTVNPGLTLVNGDYSWRVQAVNGSRTSWWTEDMFNVGAIPDAVQVLYTASGTIDSNRPTYYWEPVDGATSYRIEVSDPFGIVFSEPFSTDTYCSGGLCSVVSPIMLVNQRYSWRIQSLAEGQYAEFPWSQYATFNVIGAPTYPIQLAPSGSINSEIPTYSWNLVGGAGAYQLQVEGTGGTLLDQWYNSSGLCTNLVCSITPPTMLPGSDYLWRIRYWGVDTYGVWSPYKPFTTVPPPTCSSYTVCITFNQYEHLTPVTEFSEPHTTFIPNGVGLTRALDGGILQVREAGVELTVQFDRPGTEIQFQYDMAGVCALATNVRLYIGTTLTDDTSIGNCSGSGIYHRTVAFDRLVVSIPEGTNTETMLIDDLGAMLLDETFTPTPTNTPEVPTNTPTPALSSTPTNTPPLCNPSDILRRASVGPDGTQGNEFSDSPRLSADGRYVLYHSVADNLVTGDTNGFTDIFMYDRLTCQNILLSKAVAAQADEGSMRPSISSNGRYVVFTSWASNLVTGDTPFSLDVFVLDRTTSQIERISVSAAGTQADGLSDYASISGDGRYVVFESEATNLVANDTNGLKDIFMRDRTTGQTTLISRTASAQANSTSGNAVISDDGYWIAFASDASNLVAGDANGMLEDVFLYNRITGLLTQVSAGGNHISRMPTISANGRYIAFESHASNFVPGDTNSSPDIFVRDMQLGQIRLVSTGNGVTNVFGPGGSFYPQISGNGNYIIFSTANNYAAEDTSDYDLYIRKVDTNETLYVTPHQSPGLDYFDPAIALNANYFAFSSYATDLVVGDTNGTKDVFVGAFAFTPGTPTNTPTATLTHTPAVPTNTPTEPATPTDTPVIPTNTPTEPATATPTLTPMPTNTPQVPTNTPTAHPNGLQGSYYNNKHFSNLVLTQVDARINFNWGTDAPAPGVNPNTFSIRWLGQVMPEFSETYTFYIHADDGVRLWVNGILIIDSWINGNFERTSTPITLTAGQKYDIKLEYYEDTDRARVRLSWSSASQPKQVIPARYFFLPVVP